MRAPGLVLVSALAAALAAAPAAPAAADPTPKRGEKLCEFSDQRLAQVSGLVATKKGYTAVSDGGEVLEVFDLNRKCGVVERHSFQLNPFDPEDLAITKDGTLWVADTGDNNLERPTVALWKISPDRSNAAIYRMTYPEGKKHDAEALLMQPDGKPVIVTRDLDGAGVSGIYIAKTPLQEDESVPLTKAGEWRIKSTDVTGNRFGVVGQKLVTGGTVSADGKRAIVRTYSDAYEWKVSKGNVVAALTKGKPVRTPLPGEAQGEAITLSLDGKKYVTASEAVGQNTPATMYSYTPYQPPPPKPKETEAAGAGWFSGLSLQDIKWIIAGFGVLGLVLVVVGVFGIRRARGLVARRGRRPVAGRGTGSRSAGGPRRASGDPTETAEMGMSGGAFDDLRSDGPPARGGWGADAGRDAPGDEWGPRNAQGRVRRTEPMPRGDAPGPGARPYGSASGRAPRPRPADAPRTRYPRGDGDDPRYRRPPSGGGWPASGDSWPG